MAGASLPLTVQTAPWNPEAELELAVCRFPAGSSLPAWANPADWATKGVFFSATWTKDELSLIVPVTEMTNPHLDVAMDSFHKGHSVEKEWNVIKVEGPLDFALIGILSSLAGSLAAAGVSIFAVSTYDTDYLLVKTKDLKQATETLSGEGHNLARQTH